MNIYYTPHVHILHYVQNKNPVLHYTAQPHRSNYTCTNNKKKERKTIFFPASMAG